RASFAQFAREQLRALLVSVWLLGSVVVLLRLVWAHWQLRRITRSASAANHVLQLNLDQIAQDLEVNRPVRLLVSASVATPCTAGWRHPIILLPSCTEWTHTRQQAVFTHELAHIARADSLTQTVASVACALFWFHPGFWLAARLLRAESERAADDCVINSGVAPLDYADHLLAIALGSSSRLRVPTVALAMARSSQLELRLRAMLNKRQSRRVVTRHAQRVLGVAALTAVIPFAALQARVQQPQPKAPMKVPVAVPAPLAPSTVVVPSMQPPSKPVPVVVPPNAPAAIQPLPGEALSVVVPPNALATFSPLPGRAVTVVVPPIGPAIVPPLPSRAIPAVAPPNAPATIQPLPSKAVPVVIPPVGPVATPPLPSKAVPVVSPPVPTIAPPVVVSPRTAAPARRVIVDTTYEITIEPVAGDTLTINIPAGGNVVVHGSDSKTARLKVTLGGKYWRATKVYFYQRNPQSVFLTAATEIKRDDIVTNLPEGGFMVLRTGEPLSQGYVPATIDNEFELWVPRKMNVKYNSPIGSFTTNGVEGNLDGATKLGAIDISNASGKAKLSTENGNVRVTASTLTGSVHTDCGAVDVSTGGNKLSATTKFDPTPSKDPRYANTLMIVDGTISSEYCRLKPRKSAAPGVNESIPYGPLAIDSAPNGGSLHTRSGDITVGSSAGVLSATTSNANIDVRSMGGDITAINNRGNINIRAVNLTGSVHNVWAHALAGTVTIELPDSIDAMVDIEVSYSEAFLQKFNRAARIRDDRALPQTESAEWNHVDADTPRKVVRSAGTLGKGTGRIYIRVTDGDVVLKRTRG
ncbi:MAG: M56 family metallopeptidase, partial [Gemmatimonas sp.]